LRGFGEGLSIATPPKGVYGILSTYYASDDLYDGNGDKVANTDTDVALAIPIVLLVPGWKVLGADYSIVAGLPLIYTRSPTIAGVRGAPLPAAQPHRDHVRTPEGAASGRRPLRPMPNRLLLSRRARRHRHLLAVINES
jgi:hypothetical protein